jgi:hypothetical protein
MPWAPEQFEDAKVRILTRAFEEAVTGWHRSTRRDDADAAERGHGLGIANSERHAGDAIRGASRRAFDELRQLLVDVYGTVPPEAADWLHQAVVDRANAAATGLGRQLQERRTQNRVATNGADEHVRRAAAETARDIDIELLPLRLRAQLAELTPPVRRTTTDGPTSDVFICHASEDKQDVAEPLANRLVGLGYEVWLDKFALKLGDRLLEKIDEGINTCRFGVVILSPRFFEKQWPKRELAGLAAREDAEDRPFILPVRVNLTQAELARHSALLAAVLGVEWSRGIDEVIRQIVDVVGAPVARDA